MGKVYRYSDEVKQFIADNVEGTTTSDLVELTNSRFGLDFTISKMRSYKKNHGLKSRTRLGIEPGQPTDLYPARVMQYINDNHVGTGPKEMTDLLNSNFGTNYTHRQINAYYKNRKLNSGLDGRFKPGHVPFNKGKKGITTGGVETQFKKGHLPHNYQPVGTVRVNTEGYIDIKIADPNKWKGKHILVWEEHNGPVPKGHAVIFGDRNRRNFDPENLILVTRGQLLKLNQQSLIQEDAELTRMGVAIVTLQEKVVERE